MWPYKGIYRPGRVCFHLSMSPRLNEYKTLIWRPRYHANLLHPLTLDSVSTGMVHWEPCRKLLKLAIWSYFNNICVWTVANTITLPMPCSKAMLNIPPRKWNNAPYTKTCKLPTTSNKTAKFMIILKNSWSKIWRCNLKI